MQIFLPSVFAVWHRHFLAWRDQWQGTFITTFANPLIFLLGFSVGVGSVINTMSGVGYLAFVLPGVMMHVTMFQGGFEPVIHMFARMLRERMWHAVLVTPVSLHQLLMGELFWAGCKAGLAGLVMLLVGALFGGVATGWQGLLAVPLILFGGLMSAVVGMLYLSFIRTHYDQNAFFTFWLLPPMFFSGTFFELSRLPEWLQWVAQVFPQTHAIVLARSITAGLPITATEVLYHLTVLIGMGLVCYVLAYQRIKNRLLS